MQKLCMSKKKMYKEDQTLGKKSHLIIAANVTRELDKVQLL